MHFTNECKKWDQNGNLKKNFKSKVRLTSETPSEASKSYAQLYAENKNSRLFKRSLRKLSRRLTKIKMHKYESDSDSSYDSDSS